MSLCVIIGTGQVGDHVAAVIKETVPDAELIGLVATREALSGLVPPERFLSLLEFSKLDQILTHLQSTDVVIAGDSIGSWRLRWDREAARDLRSFWFPHAYYQVVQNFFSKRPNLNLQNIIKYLPQLGLRAGSVIGAPAGYGPNNDFRAAVAHVQHQKWRKVRQSAIVDDGRVILEERNGGTDELIIRFGRSSQRRIAHFPVLCKISIQPFENIRVPTIGLNTVELCILNGIRAILIDGDKTIIMQKSEIESCLLGSSICIFAL